MIRRTAMALGLASSIAVSVFLSGCLATPSTDGTTAATTSRATIGAGPNSASASVDAPSAEGQCSEASIQSSLPNGGTLQDFQCDVASPFMWAAARVEPEGQVVFMRSNGSPWVLVETQEACGSGPSHAPQSLAAMCPKE